ncbi:MAG: autotransporter domain-containing protein [Rhizobiaceae bacterium]|nr:autotransporter domain-containing protein [Rhizobiaceae bacterium]
MRNRQKSIHAANAHARIWPVFDDFALTRGQSSRLPRNTALLVLLATTALTAASGSAIAADEIIDLGAVETVIGGPGGGTKPEPWIISDDLYVGDHGTGTLTISSGGLVSSDNAFLGEEAGSDGTVTVTGANSILSTSQRLQVGVGGTGTLNLLAGGVASSGLGTVVGNEAGSLGTANVIGAGSNLEVLGNLIVGSIGTGTLNISAGGGSRVFGFGYIGSNSTGALNITGAGSTWVGSGRLYVGFFGDGTMNVSAGAVVTNTTDGRIGEAAGFTGEVNVTGAGSRWTSGGTLVVGELGNGNLTISNGATVGAAAAILANQSGSTGTLNIGAGAGKTAVAAGTLNTPTLTFGAGTGTLVFNHTGSGYEFDPQMNGSGVISHLAGTTNLTADNSGFTGTTTVTGGTLLVNGTLGGAVSVNGRGTLGGTGTLGGITLGSGGTLAPGNSVGTLNVASATFGGGSTYEVELNGGGFVAGVNNDLLRASGVVTLNGGTVLVRPENGASHGTTFTPGAYAIITATGGVIGRFDALADDYAFLDFVLDYSSRGVDLISSLVGGGTGTCPPGLTFNQNGACESVLSLGSGSLYTAVINLSNGEAPGALDLLSGEVHASTQMALFDDSRFAREAAIDRLHTNFGEEQGDGGTSEPGANALWAQGYGAWGRWAGDDNGAAMQRAAGGFFTGADGELTDSIYLGLMGGYGHSSVSVDARMSAASLDSYTLGAYGGGAWGGLSVMGGVAHSWHRVETVRRVAFTGFADSLSTAYDARTFQAYAEAAYGFDLGDARIEPFANVAYVHLDADGYLEAGGAAALAGVTAGGSAALTTLGIRSKARLNLGGADVVVTGGIGWRHAFGDAATSVHRFAAGGDSLLVTSTPLAENTLVLDAGIEMNLTDSATLGVAYDGQFGRDFVDHGGKATLNIRF